MEIKQGDTVRVSKDAQEIFVYGLNPLWFTEESTVVSTHPDGVVIKLNANNYLATGLPIPTKYLIKVDGDYKPKFKKGDKVRFKKVYTVVSVDDGQVFIDSAGNHIDEDCLELYTEPTTPTIKVGDRVCCYNVLHLKCSKKEDYMGVVTSITDMGITVQLDNGGTMLSYRESDLELVQPTEQTEAEKTFDNQIRDVLNGVEHKDYGHPIQAVMANLDRVLHGCDSFVSIKERLRKAYTDTFDWDAYAADLAKEIALKVVNKYDNPTEAAECAVQVAKAVVEGLKRK